MQKANVERRRRMGFIQNFLERHKIVEVDKLTGQMMMQFGVSKRDARDEINGVVQAMGYEKNGNLIKVENLKDSNGNRTG